MPSNIPSTPLPNVPEAHMVGYCKPGKKELTCRWFAADKTGFVCLKKTPVRAVIEERFAAGTLTARGDNCPGLEPVA